MFGRRREHGQQLLFVLAEFFGIGPERLRLAFRDVTASALSGDAIPLAFNPAAFGTTWHSTIEYTDGTRSDGIQSNGVALIQEPSALTLLGLAGLAATRRRKL